MCCTKRLSRRIQAAAAVAWFVCLLLAPSLSYAAAHEVVYVEGFPYVRDLRGEEIELDLGDVVRNGETVITGRGEAVELEAEGYTVYIEESTVFSLREREYGGRKTDVLSCALGKLSFSRDKFLGSEPRLATNSAICGVRGTRFTLYAGEDGSSLIVVKEGRVEVEAAGVSVEVAANKGVEVAAGLGPGEVFDALETTIDYASWNEERLGAFLEDPVRGAVNIERQMDDFIAQIAKIAPLYLESKSRLEAAREALEAKKERGEPVEAYYEDTVLPLEQETTFYILNLRYYSLSGLSLRRYVLSRLYLALKARYVTDPDDPVFSDFLEVHDRILGKYDSAMARPYLVAADI